MQIGVRREVIAGEEELGVEEQLTVAGVAGQVGQQRVRRRRGEDALALEQLGRVGGAVGDPERAEREERRLHDAQRRPRVVAVERAPDALGEVLAERVADDAGIARADLTFELCVERGVGEDVLAQERAQRRSVFGRPLRRQQTEVTVPVRERADLVDGEADEGARLLDGARGQERGEELLMEPRCDDASLDAEPHRVGEDLDLRLVAETERDVGRQRQLGAVGHARSIGCFVV